MCATPSEGDWVASRVLALRHWDDRHFSLIVERHMQAYEAGQFVKLCLPDTKGWVSRPFSLVSAPHQGVLEFYMAAVLGGAMSPRLQQLQPDDIVWVSKKAWGHLTLTALHPCETLWLIAAGTGLSPFISMLRTGIPECLAKQIILVHGVRHAAEQHYREELKVLFKAYTRRVKMMTAVTRQCGEGALLGRITELLTKGRLEQLAQAPLQPETTQVFLCGNPEMVKAARGWLCQERGFQKSHHAAQGNVLIERYW